MTINNFTPTVWTAKLLLNLNDAHVFAQGFNRDYEGEIGSLGDSVKINSMGRVTIQSYTKNSTITGPETLDDAQMVLLIDQSKAFNFEIDDIDKRQQTPKLMNDAMTEAAWGLADTADAYLAGVLSAGVQSANKLSAATSVGTGPTDDDAYEILVDLDVLLTENNVPRDSTQRWAFVPPWYEGVLRKDVRFISFGTDKNRENLRGRPVGEASGFTIYVSNNVPVTSLAYTVIAGYTGAATFAEQLPPDSFEAFRPEDSFSDALKALHLYGSKVTRPYALASVVATKAT